MANAVRALMSDGSDGVGYGFGGSIAYGSTFTGVAAIGGGALAHAAINSVAAMELKITQSRIADNIWDILLLYRFGAMKMPP
ncbi:MAG TPA: hypothetical protein VII69_13465 [Candidatus Eremiobacteraceae bacterium]